MSRLEAHWLPVVLILGSLAAIGGTIAGRLHDAGGEKPQAQSLLYIAPEKLNFGDAWETDHFEWTLPVQNRGANRVTISQARTSCSCTSITPDKFTLDPGQSRDLALVIDLRRKSDAKSDQMAFEVSIGFDVRGGDGESNQRFEEFRLAGQVQSAILVPRAIYLGRSSELAPTPSIEIPIEIIRPVAKIEAQADSHGFASVAIAPSDKQRRITLRLGSPSQFPKGLVRGTITLTVQLPSGSKLPLRQVQYDGEIISDLVPEPQAIQAGGRQLGDSIEAEVRFHSATGRPIQGVEAEVDGAGLTVESLPGIARFRIRQRVAKAGQQRNRVRFTAESGGRKVTSEVEVFYIGFETR